MASGDDLKEFWTSLGMSQHFIKFDECGYNDLDFILSLSPEELEDMFEHV